MPKGSKKRKSAKKKMENQPDNKLSSSASARPDGDDGEVSLTASQDYHNHLTEIEGEEIQTKKEGSRSDEKAVQEREFKIGVESYGKNRSVLEQDEMETRKSHNGGSLASSGNSSDYEVHGINNGRATEDPLLVFDSVKVSDPLSGKTTEAIHSVLVEEAKVIPSVYSENIPLLNEQVKVADEHLCSVEDKIDASLEREKSAIDQSTEKISTFPPLIPPRATADKESENEKDYSVTQPLLVPSPSPIQKASWKSCCGLFEVFSGSGR